MRTLTVRSILRRSSQQPMHDKPSFTLHIWRPILRRFSPFPAKLPVKPEADLSRHTQLGHCVRIRVFHRSGVEISNGRQRITPSKLALPRQCPMPLQPKVSLWCCKCDTCLPACMHAQMPQSQRLIAVLHYKMRARCLGLTQSAESRPGQVLNSVQHPPPNSRNPHSVLVPLHSIGPELGHVYSRHLHHGSAKSECDRVADQGMAVCPDARRIHPGQ